MLDELRENLQPRPARGLIASGLATRNAKASAERNAMPIVLQRPVFSVETGRRRFPNGQEHDVEIVRHAAVGRADPDRDDGRVIIVKQYRSRVGPRDVGVSRRAAERGRIGGRCGARANARKRSAWCRTASTALRGLFPAPGLLRRGADLLPRVGPPHAAAGLTAQAGRRRGHHDADRRRSPRHARWSTAARSSI